MTAETIGIHQHSRPSAGVLATALRFLIAGWAGLITKAEGRYTMPTTHAPEEYVVIHSGEQLTCTCPAGQQQRHCYHVTMIQILRGLSKGWGTEEPIIPWAEQDHSDEPQTAQPTEQEQANAAATTAAVRRPRMTAAARKLAQELEDAGVYQAGPKTLRFSGHSAFGILSRCWQPLVDNLGVEEATKTVAVAAALTHTANNGYDAVTGEQLVHTFGTDSSIAWECGIFVPRQTPAAAEAAA